MYSARDIEPFLAVEVILERRGVHPRAARDLASRGALEAALPEKLQRRSNDPGASLLAPGITRVDRVPVLRRVYHFVKIYQLTQMFQMEYLWGTAPLPEP